MNVCILNRVKFSQDPLQENVAVTVEYLPRRLYLRIRELAGEMTPLQIAEVVPLSLITIEGVLAGKLQPSRIVVDDDHPLREEMLTATRCDGCGARVFRWPCLACQLRVPAGERGVAERLAGKGLRQK